MSWKSIVIAGLLCVLAVPAFAFEANPITAELLGLDTDGNWVWEISVDPDQTLFADPTTDTPDRGTGGSVAIELGVQATDRGVVSAAPILTNFPVPSPAGPPLGNGPAGWAILPGSVSALRPNGISDIDGDSVEDEGVRYDAATDRVIAYLGSEFFGSLNGGANWDGTTNGDSKAAFRVHTERPTSASLTTTLEFLGAYNADGTVGGALPLFAEDQPTGTDQIGVALASASKSVLIGNANLDGTVGPQDLVLLGGSWNLSGKTWAQGDFDGNGTVGPQDLVLLGGQWNNVDSNWTTPGSIILATTPGAGSGGIATPEPASMVLLTFGVATLALRRRRGA